MTKREFSKVYQKYLKIIYNFAYYLTGQKELAEDTTANAFANTWEYTRTNQIENMKAWLFRSVRNLVINESIKNKKYTPIDLDVLIAQDEQLDENIDFKNMINLINKSLKPVIYKEVLLLKYKFELNYLEIANILNKSESNVRKIHERALAKLKLLI